MLNVFDEFSHECLAIRVARRLKAIDVIDVLSDLFILRGIPGHIRSDNGPEFVAEAVQEWIGAVGVKIAYIERGSPWENGYIESFNARLRDELLDSEIFYSLREAQIVIESWRRHYNGIRLQGSSGSSRTVLCLWVVLRNDAGSDQRNELALGPVWRNSHPAYASGIAVFCDAPPSVHLLDVVHLPRLVEERFQSKDSDGLRQVDDDIKLAANNLETLMRRMSGTSTQEIDSLIGELKVLREILASDGSRMERELN